ncbi:hypothetical protein, conserved [Babesia ovata]|uniref:Uncharacterized protein n=1 Tax=Babesia ovata TaxID=189622 RepID=A0A2H6KEB4_9APIC|nr:uncharacterized protein BOVATA_028260 [Babesia ovata]GBE61333.1 hypothetical protein, conserved [Babesia ovata]
MAPRRQRSRSRFRARLEEKPNGSRWRPYQRKSRRSRRSRSISISEDRGRWMERNTPRNSLVSREYGRDSRRLDSRSPSGSSDRSVRTSRRAIRRSRDRSESRGRDPRRRRRRRRSSSISRSVRSRRIKSSETRRRRRSFTRSSSPSSGGTTSSDDSIQTLGYRGSRSDRIREHRRLRSGSKFRSRSIERTPETRSRRRSRNRRHRRDVRHRISRGSSRQSPTYDAERTITDESVLFRGDSREDKRGESVTKDLVEDTFAVTDENKADDAVGAEQYPDSDDMQGFPPPQPYQQLEDFFEPKRHGAESAVPPLPEILPYGDKVTRYHSQDVHFQAQQADEDARDKWHKQMIDLVETNATYIRRRLELNDLKDERSTFISRQHENKISAPVDG